MAQVNVTPCYNEGLAWAKYLTLFVVSNDEIKRFDACTRPTILEPPVPGTNRDSCIALTKHGKYVAYLK